jgi:pyruvate-formate lyase-activating enzyme
MAKTFYFKATTKDGRVAVRSSQTKAYTRAFIHADGRRANWATAGHVPPEASKRPGELVDAVEITAKEYREFLRKD